MSQEILNKLRSGTTSGVYCIHGMYKWSGAVSVFTCAGTEHIKCDNNGETIANE